MSLTWLDPIDAQPLEEGVMAQGQAHPMRTVTHAAAAEVGAWSGDTPRQVRATFDRLAGEWHTRHSADKLDALGDAIVRGGLLPSHGTWLELGAGDGWASAYLAVRAPRVVAMDLSMQMLLHSPADGVDRVQADADALPLADHAITVAVLMNMLLFPTELDRVLAPGGRLVWVSSRGPATPIYLAPEQVIAALPGRWGGTAGRHGTATWAVLRRLG
ncbi:MAG TPA: class I SAM-dependent methyltransferase [Euzebya sp.]|nr:class I SAM-dependent methyltransferase [Euzebya sp.]